MRLESDCSEPEILDVIWDDKTEVTTGTMDQNRQPGSDATRWIAEWSHLPLRGRILLATYMVIGAFGGLFGSHTVLTEFPRSWVAWAVSLVILEPVGLACALGLIVLAFPHSAVTGWFTSTLKRAKTASIIVGLIFASAFLGSVVFLLYELWKM